MPIRERPLVDNSIPILDLPDGILAEITQWAGYSNYIGWHVQRSGGYIVAIGKADSYWVRDKLVRLDELRVKILPDGYLLEVTDNQPK